jgi:3'-phosphoadenosine 5'-phosphosulfate sulfotransferase (PAPS reductase)/FAD synthetase
VSSIVGIRRLEDREVNQEENDEENEEEKENDKKRGSRGQKELACTDVDVHDPIRRALARHADIFAWAVGIRHRSEAVSVSCQMKISLVRVKIRHDRETCDKTVRRTNGYMPVGGSGP